MNRQHYIINVNGQPIFDASIKCIADKRAAELVNGGKYIVFHETGRFSLLTFFPEIDTLTKSYYEKISL